MELEQLPFTSATSRPLALFVNMERAGANEECRSGRPQPLVCGVSWPQRHRTVLQSKLMVGNWVAVSLLTLAALLPDLLLH